MIRSRFALVVGFACGSLGAMPVLQSCSSTQTTGEQLHDAAITTKVKAKLTAAPNIDPFDIAVETEEGTVYLMGRVQEQYQREEAERLALEIEGVVRVVNHIEVGRRS